MHVHQHTLLQSQGGTARVARDLQMYLTGQGIPTIASFELQDSAAVGLQIPPEQIANQVDDAKAQGILHLHSTADWSVCLEFCRERATALAITLHDCRLLTGGCPFPLSCQQWVIGCSESCPQHFSKTAEHWEKIRVLLDNLKPILMAPSGWLAGMVRTLHPQARVRVIPNGIAAAGAERSSKIECKKKLGIQVNSKLVLFIAHGGKQAMYKGGHLWTRIWKQIKTREPQAVALAIGGEKTTRNGDFWELPYLVQQDLVRFMDAADVLVYPSLADNHPLVVLEAMSRGLPCVAFASGGIPEQIIHEQTGLLSPSGDIEHLADSAVRILQEPAWGQHLAKLAFHRYHRFFTVERMGRTYIDAYRQLLQATPRPEGIEDKQARKRTRT
ncbi:MAG TPA: glycosyltransferase [Desulfonatronum sp.]|nr:glycosyltransferase [Desulfonatronum sp.]